MSFFGPDKHQYINEPKLSSKEELFEIDPKNECEHSLDLKLVKYGVIKELISKKGSPFQLMEVVFVGADPKIPVKGSILGQNNIELFKKDCIPDTFMRINFIPKPSYPSGFKKPLLRFDISFGGFTTYEAIPSDDE